MIRATLPQIMPADEVLHPALRALAGGRAERGMARERR